MLEELIAGVGWFGFGYLLRRERPVLGALTMLLGAGALADSLGIMLGVPALAIGLYLYLLLAPIWALLLGIDLLRRPVSIET